MLMSQYPQDLKRQKTSHDQQAALDASGAGLGQGFPPNMSMEAMGAVRVAAAAGQLRQQALMAAGVAAGPNYMNAQLGGGFLGGGNLGAFGGNSPFLVNPAMFSGNPAGFQQQLAQQQQQQQQQSFANQFLGSNGVDQQLLAQYLRSQGQAGPGAF
jgi:hypothetical protein